MIIATILLFIAVILSGVYKILLQLKTNKIYIILAEVIMVLAYVLTLYFALNS